jgi:hypothetical protein
MMTAILLIEDEKIMIARDLRKLKSEMDSLKMTYLRLELSYNKKKLHYEEIDKSRALKDGRLRIVKSDVRKEVKTESLTQEQINTLLDELNDLVK